jgi:hypothetical protein
MLGSSALMPNIGAWWPGWPYRVRPTTAEDEHVLNELRVPLLAENIEAMDIPMYDSLGAYLIESEDGVAGALALRSEHLACVYVAATHRRRGVGLIALGVVAEHYFINTDVPALAMPPMSVAAKALASSICDPGRRYLTQKHWLEVVRPRILRKIYTSCL